MALLGLTTVILLGLKVANVIDWSLWIVFAPLWLPVVLGVFVALLALCAVLLDAKRERERDKQDA